MKNKQTVLIVDDIVDNLNVSAQILMQNSINVIITQSGKEALTLTEKFIPDLILLDIMMPEMDGYEVCSILKNNKSTQDIPIIFLSAINETNNIIKGFELGAVDYINKPFILEELVSRVQTHLKIHKQNKELINKEALLQDEKAKLLAVINSVSDIIFYKDIESRFTGFNKEFKNYLGKEADEIIGKTDFDLFTEEEAKTFLISDKKIIKTKQELKYSGWTKDYLGQEIYYETIKAPLINYDGETIGIVAISHNLTELKKAEKELEIKNDEINKKNNDILASIRYAKTIQTSLLPEKMLFDYLPGNSFVLFKPKDIVSGDFYYLNKIGNNIYISVADCTGHGVPGGFISMLGIKAIHGILREKNEQKPAEVLNCLRGRIKDIFRGSERNNTNGMDIAFCCISLETNVLQYAGAFNPLWIIRDDEFIEIKATRNPIGFYPVEKEFVNNTIQLKNKDKIYLFSDGYKDQLNEDGTKKYTHSRFKDIFFEIRHLSMKQQKLALDKKLKDWQGDYEQVDDITIMGIEWKM